VSDRIARNSLLQTAARGSALLVCWALFTAVAPASSGGDNGRIHWKQITQGQLKLDDKPPLTWNVYQPDKKKDANLVLVLLGRRYLMLDTKAKLVYEVSPAQLQAQGKDLESDNLALPARLIPSTDWTLRDVGPAESIRLTLGDYGRVLDVQLPHLPDMRAFY
jgi:hypothetical protein